MIRLLTEPNPQEAPHSAALKAHLSSLFRFQDDLPPPNPAAVEVTSITYVNYKKVVEFVRTLAFKVNSESVMVDPAALRDGYYIMRLAVERVRFNLNQSDTRREHLKEFLGAQAAWKRWFRWTQAYDAWKRYLKLEENRAKLKRLLDRLEHAYADLQRSVRHVALAVVKSQVGEDERHRILDVEGLEYALRTVYGLIEEIEYQMERVRDTNRVEFYEADRARAHAAMRTAAVALEGLSTLLVKARMDVSFLTIDLRRALSFDGRRGLWWSLSDRHVFRLITGRLAHAQLLADTLGNLLAPETHRLNAMAERVSGLGFLINYSLPAPQAAGPQGPPPPDEVPAAGTSAERRRRSMQKINAGGEPYGLAEAYEPSLEDEYDEPVLTLGLEELDEPRPRTPAGRSVKGF